MSIFEGVATEPSTDRDLSARRLGCRLELRIVPEDDGQVARALADPQGAAARTGRPAPYLYAFDWRFMTT